MENHVLGGEFPPRKVARHPAGGGRKPAKCLEPWSFPLPIMQGIRGLSRDYFYNRNIL